jgi:ribosomal protein L20
VVSFEVSPVDSVNPWSSSTVHTLVKRYEQREEDEFPSQTIDWEERRTDRRTDRQAEGGVEQMGRKEKIFQLAKGYRGRAKNCITASRARVEKGLQYAYRDRRTKKREFRSLWITRVNAGVRGASGPPCVAPGRWA